MRVLPAALADTQIWQSWSEKLTWLSGMRLPCSTVIFMKLWIAPSRTLDTVKINIWRSYSCLWKQILPVIVKGSRPQIVGACMRCSRLLQFAKLLKLTQSIGPILDHKFGVDLHFFALYFSFLMLFGELSPQIWSDWGGVSFGLILTLKFRFKYI